MIIDTFFLKLNLHMLIYTRSTTLSLQYPLTLMIRKKETPVPFLSPSLVVNVIHLHLQPRNILKHIYYAYSQ